jgi:hypothetical protein
VLETGARRVGEGAGTSEGSPVCPYAVSTARAGGHRGVSASCRGRRAYGSNRFGR